MNMKKIDITKSTKNIHNQTSNKLNSKALEPPTSKNNYSNKGLRW